MDIRTSTEIVEEEVKRQLFFVKAELLPREGQSSAASTKKITDLPDIPLTRIFQFVADPNFQNSSKFDNFVKSRTNAHYDLRESEENHRSIAELFRLRKVCVDFAVVVDRMKPCIDYQPIPIVIRIKGIDSKKSILYKYGLSGNLRPAVSLRRIWNLGEHIQQFETITKIIITEKAISDDLIDSLCQQKSRLKILEEVYFYGVTGFQLAESTREDNLEKLIELFSTAKYVHIELEQFSIYGENEELDGWAQEAIRRLRKSDGVDRPSVRNCRFDVRTASHEVKRFSNRHIGTAFKVFMAKVKKFKNHRCYSIVKQIVYPTARRQENDIDKNKSHIKKCRRAYRDLRSQVSHLSRADRLMAKQKFTQLIKCFKNGRRVNCQRVKLLIRELHKVQSIEPDSNKQKEEEETGECSEKVFKKSKRSNESKKRSKNKKKRGCDCTRY